MKKRLFFLIAVCCFILVLSGTGFSAEQGRVKQRLIAEEAFSGTLVVLTPLETVSNVTLNISGPRQFQASIFSEYNIPSIELWNYGEVGDGLYKYEITAASDEQVEVVNSSELDNGRDKENSRLRFKSVSQSGYFRVRNGEIMAKDITPDSEGGDTHDPIQ